MQMFLSDIPFGGSVHMWRARHWDLFSFTEFVGGSSTIAWGGALLP